MMSASARTRKTPGFSPSDAAAPLRDADPVLLNSLVQFVAERQTIFERRRRGEPPPWTPNSILSTVRFTNVYRAADRLSQYLINTVQRGGDQTPEEVVFRTLLFRMFNRIETFVTLASATGGMPTRAGFDPLLYTLVLDQAVRDGAHIWGSAYIIKPPRDAYGGSKHKGWLNLFARMIRDGVPEDVATATHRQAVYERLRAYPTVGVFFAYQWTTDLGYAGLRLPPEDADDGFVVPGGGALRSAAKLLGGRVRATTVAALIRALERHQERLFEAHDIRFPYLRLASGRRHRIQLSDWQNVLCEVEKYWRLRYPELSHGGSRYTRVKQYYNTRPEAPRLPPIAYRWPDAWSGVADEYP